MRSKTDSEIEQRVLKELRLSDKVGSAEICVFASNGVVELRGSVPGYKNKSVAEKSAYRADDIRGVINEIRIKPRTKESRKDSWATSQEDDSDGLRLQNVDDRLYKRRRREKSSEFTRTQIRPGIWKGTGCDD